MKERVDFAKEGLTLSRERVENQIFSDEVWAMGGPFTTSYVTDLHILSHLQAYKPRANVYTVPPLVYMLDRWQ
jgi:hypothetical protein